MCTWIGHSHSHALPNNSVSSALSSIGLVAFADRIEHSWLATSLSIFCFAASLLTHASLLTDQLPAAAASMIVNEVRCILLAGTFILSGIPQVVEALCIAGGGDIDTHVLMSLAVVGTLYLGMAQEGALLLLLFQVSHFLEHKLTARAAGNMERLFSAIPSTATVVDFAAGQTPGPRLDSARRLAASAVQVGQHVVVRPGEQVPLDGVVAHGSANVSLQHISGESHPVRVAVGSTVPAGSLNTDGLLVVRVASLSTDSTPARIARLTAQAQSERPKLTRMLDSIGAWWSKTVIVATLATVLILPLCGVPLLAPGGALYRAMGVLTAGSPCAVVLVPLAYVCAIARITRKGVLVKSAGALEDLASCSVVAVDKTGTITSGVMTLTEAFVLSHGSAPLSQATSAQIQLAAPGHTQGPPDHNTHGSNTHSDGLASQPSAPATVAAHSHQHHDSHTPDNTSTAHAAARNVPDSGTHISSNGSSSSSGGGGGQHGSSSSSSSSQFGGLAVDFAVALSRASTHPVSRALAEYGLNHKADVTVTHFEQVPGAGVQGLCQSSSSGAHIMARLGSLEFVSDHIRDPHFKAQLEQYSESHRKSSSKALSFLILTPCHHTSTSSHSSTSSLHSSLHNSSSNSSSSSSESLPSSPSAAESPTHPAASEWHSSGEPLPHAAMFCFEDVVPESVAPAVRLLQSGKWQGLGSNLRRNSKQLVMLTGDNAQAAAQVAHRVGILDYKAGMKPEDKLKFVLDFNARASGAGLVMVGDGINDAPALAAACVGIAIASTPSDMVAAAADVIILNGQGVANLPWLFKIAANTQAIVRQNLILALGAVAFATLPTVAGVFPLWLAVLLHEGSTLAVALNSLRLLLDPEFESTLASGFSSTWSGLKDLFKSDEHHHHNHAAAGDSDRSVGSAKLPQNGFSSNRQQPPSVVPA
ncbi:MAG: hypothetical protein WDW38_003116 [Sanguina aurantia]